MLRYPHLTRHLLRLAPSLQLFQRPDHLRLRVPALRHTPFPFLSTKSYLPLCGKRGAGHYPSGHVIFWQDITTPILENVRKRLRSLVKFIDKTKRQNIYTDFLDMMGEGREIELPGFSAGLDIERFRDKTHQFLKAHENDPVIHKLRWNERLNAGDLDVLEKILVQAGAASAVQLRKVRSNGELGLFVRSLVGLDREAAKRAFDGFLKWENPRCQPDPIR